MNFEIKGGNLPVVTVTLNSGESMFTESGGMSWMTGKHPHGNQYQRRSDEGVKTDPGR